VSALVAGIGLHPFGRFDSSVDELGAHAARAALRDAGLRFRDVDVTIVANAYEGMAKAQRICQQLGSTGQAILSTESACASSASALAMGSALIASGDVDTVLCLGVEKAPKGFIAGAGFEPWQADSGVGVAPVYFALQASELLASTDTSVEDLADVSVKNHAHGVLNPNAMFQKECDRQEVLESRMVCPPLTLLMLCAPNEGAAAVVLTSAAAARRRGLQRCIELRAVTLTSRSPSDWFVPSPSRIAGTRNSMTRRAVNRALSKAKTRIEDVHLIECQDTDAGSELIAYSDLGLCAPGDEAALLRSGDTSRRGRIPVNVSGGLLSKGEPLGASGLGQVHEVVTQLRGEAGERQVPNAHVGLCHVMGAGHVASVAVLSA
jgi:acetyl-CoA acetyltransferase